MTSRPGFSNPSSPSKIPFSPYGSETAPGRLVVLLQTSWNFTLSSLDATMIHPSSIVREHHRPPSFARGRTAAR